MTQGGKHSELHGCFLRVRMIVLFVPIWMPFKNRDHAAYVVGVQSARAEFSLKIR